MNNPHINACVSRQSRHPPPNFWHRRVKTLWRWRSEVSEIWNSSFYPKSISTFSKSWATCFHVLGKWSGSWFHSHAGVLPALVVVAYFCHTWELDASSFGRESRDTDFLVLARRPKSLLDALSIPGLFDAFDLFAIEDLAKACETKFIIGFDFDMALSSPVPSCILFCNPLFGQRKLFELRMLMWSRWRKCVQSSRVKLPFVDVSVSWCLVSMYLIWILGSKLILSNNQWRATLWVLETCLIVGLLPFMIILIIVVFKDIQQSFLTRSMHVCGNESTLFRSSIFPWDVIAWNFLWSICLRVGFWCQCIWFESWGPNWFYQTTYRTQLCGFWKHVSLLGFCLCWSSWSLLHYPRRCKAWQLVEKISRLRRHDRHRTTRGSCPVTELGFVCWFFCLTAC